ncbi:MAG: YraN family protein [Actinobacteria bacterium]|nr:YraN family protein [Actinomycetota bacterium]
MEPRPYRPHHLGRAGEDEAVRFLHSLGYRICARNWRGSCGEVDVIALSEAATATSQRSALSEISARRAHDEFVFVEVKTRSSTTFGDPFEAITPEKYRRLYRLAREWIALNHPRAPWRIDVILLLKSVHGFELVHHKGLVA